MKKTVMEDCLSRGGGGKEFADLEKKKKRKRLLHTANAVF